MKLSPEERKIAESQYKASREPLRSFSAKVTLAGGLFILTLVAYAAYRVNDTLSRKYLLFLVLMFALVTLVSGVLLGLRPVFERFMNTAFDKLGIKETIDFKRTSGPMVTKAREIHSLSELPPELANNREVQTLLQSEPVQKLFEKTTMVTVERPLVVVGNDNISDDADAPAQFTDPTSAMPEIRVSDSQADLPLELVKHSQIKRRLARRESSTLPQKWSTPSADLLKWSLVVLGFIILVLGFLALFAYFRPPAG